MRHLAEFRKIQWGFTLLFIAAHLLNELFGPITLVELSPTTEPSAADYLLQTLKLEVITQTQN